jgi:hypothetical protein
MSGGQLWSGTTQTPNLQKGRLLRQVRTLPLGPFLPPVGVSYPISQGQELCLDQVPDLASVRKLALEKGDLPNCLIGLPTSRSQQ